VLAPQLLGGLRLAGETGREVWRKAGAAGLLGWEVPTSFGGSGVHDFRYNTILAEEIVATGSGGLGFAGGLH